jgi:hypothetical protein
MSASSDREDVLVLSQRKDAKSTKESSKGGSETKHVSTKSASEKSKKDHKSPEPKKSKSSGTPKDKKSDKKEKSKKSQREEELSDDEDAMEVDEAPAPAKADFVDDLDDEFGLSVLSQSSRLDLMPWKLKIYDFRSSKKRFWPSGSLRAPNLQISDFYYVYSHKFCVLLPKIQRGQTFGSQVHVQGHDFSSGR